MRTSAIGAVLLLLSMQASHAANCDMTISGNCPCLIRALETHLGKERADLLFEVWHAAYDRDDTRRSKFFIQKKYTINSTVLAYGRIKSAVGFQCGTLNVPGDGMD